MLLRLAARTCATGALLAFFAQSAAAHEGHGMQGMHWHATDTSGMLMVALLAGVALWLSRGE